MRNTKRTVPKKAVYTDADLQKFFIAVEQTADAVFMTDPKGIIGYVNPAFEKITGFSEAEALGQTPNIIKSGQHEPDFYKKLWRTILSGETFRDIVINKKKNGEFFFTDHTITPLKDENGNIIHFVGIWKDITDKVQTEKRKDEFISIASHELKTPLTSIKVFTEILKKSLNGEAGEKAHKYLQRLDEQIGKLTTLIGDLLDISKIQSGHLDFHKEYFFIAPLIKEVIEDLQDSTQKHHIVFNQNNQADVEIYADRDRLGQVMVNLLTNAIKYSPQADKIVVDMKNSDVSVEVGITDFGVGISQEHLEKIFDRFYRVYDNDDITYPGLGMGLYISSEIIKYHGGKLNVKSKKGSGSTFTFTLPLE